MRTRQIILLISLFISNIAFAQLTSPEKGSTPYVPNWDTYEFMKYGNVGTSLYTGTINYSVPIYTYKDEDFDFTLSVDYATNGFRVNHKSGSLGHGWSLSNPGMITREIHGIADEDQVTVIAPGGNGCGMRGYSQIPNKEFEEVVLADQSNTSYTALYDMESGNYYDAQPDIYSFNFCGYSGSFRRMPSQNGGPDYLLFNLSTNSRGLRVKVLSETGNIIMVDGKGYEYLFETGELAMETYNTGVGAQRQSRVRAWNLSRIKAPNGRCINYGYTPGSFTILDNSTNANNITYFPSFYYKYSYYVHSVTDGNSTTNIDTYTSKLYTSKLCRVSLPDNTRVYISYEPGATERFYTAPNGQVSDARGDFECIKDIKVYSSDSTLTKKASFSYDIQGGETTSQNHVTFLKSIDISGQGTYSFDYNQMVGYPPLGTTQSDHWGYYNGPNGGVATTNFFSNLSYDSTYNETYRSTFMRNPDFNAANSGTLNRINYPTGGYSLIEYEPHTCSHKVIRNSNTFFVPGISTLSYNESVGGVRLKRVDTFLSDGTQSDSTIYEYTLPTTFALSSGVLANSPRYGLRYTAGGVKTVDQFNLFNSIFDFSQTHIEYSHVREYKSGAGYTDYHYTTSRDYGDNIFEDEDKDKRQQVPYFTSNGYNDGVVFFNNPDRYVTNLLTPVYSYQTKRGLLWRLEQYNDDNEQVGYTNYTYDFPEIKVDTTYVVTGEIAREVYYPRYNIELRRIEETSVLDGVSVTRERQTEFNAYGQEACTRTTTSDGNVIVDKFKYAGDSLDTDGIIAMMNAAHNVNSLLSHESFVISNGTETLLSKTRYNYGQPDSINNSLFKVANIDIWSPSDGWRTKVSYEYDNLGLITQQTDTSGVSQSFVWGYNGRYPLITAKNATHSQLEQALNSAGMDLSDIINQSSYSDDTYSRMLSLANSLPHTLVDIYKFKPNVGLTEQMMPNSLKAYYSYDGYGRLTSMSDYRHNVVEQADYNLVSILPLGASLSCPDVYITDTIQATASASGGSYSYNYHFAIISELDNTQVYETTNTSGALDIKPLDLGLESNRSYRIECEVLDVISGESITVSQTIEVKPAKLYYADISDAVIDDDSGNGYIDAIIYTDTPAIATFRVELLVSGTCVITIGSRTYTYNGRADTEISVPLSVGQNNVSIAITSSLASLEANLYLVSATNGHDIGSSNTLSISY